MTNSDKELMTSDGKQNNMRIFCMSHMRKKRVLLMALLCLVGLLTMMVLFGIYAAIRIFHEDSTQVSIKNLLNSKLNGAENFLRTKRDANSIPKLSDSHVDLSKNMIKRQSDDYGGIESLLNEKYREMNKNDASEEWSDEEEIFIQKRSSDLKNSIRKLEKVLDDNEILVKSLIGTKDVSEETKNLIAKDLNEMDDEIEAMDNDIMDVITSAHLADNSIHKRIRHKRETNFESPDLDPVAWKLYSPILEEKRREKRLVQHKLAEVRDEFIRCKKAATDDDAEICDGIYSRVMDRFREITKKFKEIEAIVDDMENFNPAARSKEDEERKKKDKKKKKKDKKSSEESHESNESKDKKKKKKKTSTTEGPETPEASSSTFKPEETTAEDSTTTKMDDVTTTESEPVETTTLIDSQPDSSEKVIHRSQSRDRLPESAFNEDIELNDEAMPDFDWNRDENFQFPEDLPEEFPHDATMRPEGIISATLLKQAVSSPSAESCPAKAFGKSREFDEIRAHPKFQEDIDEIHKTHRLFKKHETVEQIVAKKIERNDRGPKVDVTRTHSSKSNFKNNEPIAASGPFINLCAQMSKQGKQVQQQPSAQQPQQQVFEPQQFPQFPLSAFGGPAVHFPVTSETMKASAKVMMNPGYNMLQYPVCFVNYPQYRSMQQPYYYPGLIPMPTQPGGNEDDIDPEFIRTSTNSGGFGYPTAPNLRPVQIPVIMPGYRSADGEQLTSEATPTYCTFLANTEQAPTHYSETTEQPVITPRKHKEPASSGKAGEKSEVPARSDNGNEANTFNIPTQHDIIYATYPNYIFAMNQSTQHHHCDDGNISCFNSNQCIPKSKWCDSKVDCMDASDETACSCKARLTKDRICDGFIDCPMGSDELGCFGCDKFQYSCYSNRKEFELNGESSSLMCYSSIEKCDGFSNCRNGKDESECSMIVRNVGAMLSYAVSASEGILHRNFKGRWYPACKNSNDWAIQACETENGKLQMQPFMSIKSISIPGPFIQPSDNRDAEPSLTDTCRLENVLDNQNNVVFVKCTEPQCGTSKIFETASHVKDKETSDRKERDADSRIVGGINAKPMEFPFIVAIYKNGNFHCGGSIYNQHWIITAAHCTRNFEDNYYEVWAGILRRSSYSPSTQISKVSHVIRHADYDSSTMKNDIALMRLKHQLTFNRWVRPICMPSEGKTSLTNNWKYGPKAGTICTTLGWGSIREKGEDPDDLKVVDVPIMSKCKTTYDQEGESVCAGETFGTRDACQGDSGGPLVCKSLKDPLEWYLLGIVSHGEGCARANEPGVYTRVAKYLDWISDNTELTKLSSELTPDQTCPGFTCVWGGNKCISSVLKCDGFVDCLGGEDEIECTINLLDLILSKNENETIPTIDPTNINEGQNDTKNVIKKDIKNKNFECTLISQFINMDQRCDRAFDCEDGTDEKNCTCRDHLKSAFSKLICDGNVDCADLSDEEGCIKCNATEFACPHSNKCIDKSLHCNGEVDCKFKEDELDCFALTDGHSVMLDVNGKPFMHTKGIVTRNIQSKWGILCDDDESFLSNGAVVAADICNFIGFKSVKSWQVVETTSSKIHATSMGPNTIDIRNAMLRKTETIDKDKCVALEVECSPFQTNSFAVHPIHHATNKTSSTTPPKSDKIEIIFVPLNSSDHKNVSVKPMINKATTLEIDRLHDLDWPWNTELFVNGVFVTNGILLGNSWVLVERTSLEISDEPLKDNFVVALFGNTNSELKIQSPYEQISRIDCLQFINDSNVMLLHLETPVEYNRHVLPAFLPVAHEIEPDTRCLAIAVGNSKKTKTLGLEIIKNCGHEGDHVCYQQTSNNTKCDDETSHQTAAIVCKSKTSGWYPKAFHKLKKGFCDFAKPTIVFDLKNFEAYEPIRKTIDHPCEKCVHHAEEIHCDAYRCPLGKCLKKHNLCDGKIDCHDGSDEHKDVCNKLSQDISHCNPSEFRCNNGKCIEKSKFCNHINDCGDKSDEPSECTCFSYLRAIDPSKLCDGVRHCWDRSDENTNYCGPNCSEGSFKCGDSIFCIPQEMVCDKRADCPNGTDEQFCHGIYHHESNDGYGEVLEKSFGIWHTKCFPKTTAPTRDELEMLCKKLGVTDVTKADARVKNPKPRTPTKSKSDEIPIEFTMFNATKVVPYSKFSPVKVNEGFEIHLKPNKPLAKLVLWDKSDHENCHQMELKCFSEN